MPCRPPSGCSVDPSNRRGPSHCGDAANHRRRPSHYGDAADDSYENPLKARLTGQWCSPHSYKRPVGSSPGWPLKRAAITKPFRAWHDLRHTALTHEAAAGNPQAYVQLKAGPLAGLHHGAVHPCGPGCSSPALRPGPRSACSAPLKVRSRSRKRMPFERRKPSTGSCRESLEPSARSASRRSAPATSASRAAR